MDIVRLLYFLLLFLVGYIIYIRKPNLICIYWLALQPIFVPVAFVLLSPFIDPESATHLYFSSYMPPAFLFIGVVLVQKSPIKLNKRSLFLLTSSLIGIILFFIIQAVIIHFDFMTVFRSTLFVIYLVAPLMLVVSDERFRPCSTTLRKFVVVIIAIQVAFCIFNLFGFRLYPEIEDDTFSNRLISGTFMRYNHLTNYLTSLYLFVSLEYFSMNNLKTNRFVILSFVIGLLVLISGSRMSLVLFVFTIFINTLVYKRSQIGKIIVVLFFAWGGMQLLSQIDVTSNKETDEGTGIERNIGGLANFLQNDLEDDDSTVAMSLYLISFHFDNPWIGNGLAYLGEDAYVANDAINQTMFVADARLAYTLVEYGIIGFSLFLFLYWSLYKIIITEGTYGDKKIYRIAFVFYIICTLTEGGIFDMGIFCMLYIFGFQNSMQLQLEADSNINLENSPIVI